jgi:hypothetical protein
MKSLQIFDKAMCCSTGVCGPQVDAVLPQFAADVDWLKSKGAAVERHNLAQEPMAFAQNPTIQSILATEGVDVLPVILVDGEVRSRGTYPTRKEMAGWVGLRSKLLPNLAVVDFSTAHAHDHDHDHGGCCSGEPGCC